MKQGFHCRLTPALGRRVALVMLVMLVTLPARVSALPVSATIALADSSGPTAGHADSSAVTPAPARGSVSAPHDAVHMHTEPAPGGPKGHAASGPRPKPLKIVVPKGTPRVLSVSLGIHHRVFPEFAEKSEAVMGKTFQVGDTRFSATVTDFEPDFVIDPATHSITSRSIEPRNPAVRLVVREQGVPQDTTWAFLNMPPHFMRNSLLAFEILRIDFADRPPLLRDSTAFGRPKP